MSPFFRYDTSHIEENIMKLNQITRDQLIKLIGPKDVVMVPNGKDMEYKLRAGRVIAVKLDNLYYEVCQ